MTIFGCIFESAESHNEFSCTCPDINFDDALHNTLIFIRHKVARFKSIKCVVYLHARACSDALHGGGETGRSAGRDFSETFHPHLPLL